MLVFDETICFASGSVHFRAFSFAALAKAGVFSELVRGPTVFTMLSPVTLGGKGEPGPIPKGHFDAVLCEDGTNMFSHFQDVGGSSGCGRPRAQPCPALPTLPKSVLPHGPNPRPEGCSASTETSAASCQHPHTSERCPQVRRPCCCGGQWWRVGGCWWPRR